MESCSRHNRFYDICKAGNILQNNLMCSDPEEAVFESSSAQRSSFIELVDNASPSIISLSSLPFRQLLSDDTMTSSIQRHACDHSCQNYIDNDINLRIGMPSHSTASNRDTISSVKMGVNDNNISIHKNDHHHCQQPHQHIQEHIEKANSNGDIIQLQSLSSSGGSLCHSTTTMTREVKEENSTQHSEIRPLHQSTKSSYNRSNSNSTAAASHKKMSKTYSTSSLNSSLSSSSSFPSRWLGLHLGMWFRVLVTYTVMAASLHPVNAKPTSDADRMYKKLQMDTVKYLAQFGYLHGPSKETQNLMSGAELERAIKALQRAGGIPQTGVPDSRTANLLTRPRCGNKDEYINEGRYSDYRFRSTDRHSRRSSSSSSNSGTDGDGYSSNDNDDDDNDDNNSGKTYRYRRRRSLIRHKRYTTANSSWKHTNLTFRFINYTPDISKLETRRVISDALRVWSDATPLSFTEERHSQADIMIQFASNYHSDGYPFDGKGMILAHAFFPGQGKGGDTHFDDDENWVANNSDSGVELFMVAAHEFGHALGLAHSGDPQALMYPWYMGFQGNFKLPQDDYLGITSLYGSKEKNRAIPKLPSSTDGGVEMIPKPDAPNKNPRPDDRATPPTVDGIDRMGPPNPCTGHIDAIIVFRTEMFVFVGKYFWRLGSQKIVTQPIEIHSFWYGFPKTLEKIDAVYERPDTLLIFFSGDRYWKFNANRIVRGFPTEGRPITEFSIPRDVKKIDAAFVWGYNKRTYLVSGDMYWKMDEDKGYVEYDYPRDMGTWKGVPVPLDAAFKNRNGKTYFFKGREFSEFYDMKMEVRKGFPKLFSRHLLNCPMDGGSYQVANAKSTLVGPEADGLMQEDKAVISQETNKKPSGTGAAPLSTSSNVSILISTFLLVLASKVATTEL